RRRIRICSTLAAARRRRRIGRRHFGASRNHSRRRRDPSHPRAHQARCALRPRIRPCPGQIVADGVPAAGRGGPAVGDLLLRHDLIARVGAERMAQLMPPYPRNGLSILTDRDASWMNAKTRGEGPHSKGVVPTFPPTLSLQSRELRQGAPKRQGREGGRSAEARERSKSEPGNLWSDAFASGLAQGSPAVADLLLGSARAEAIGSNN